MDHSVEPLIAEADLKQKVTELARRISADYAGKSLLVVGVLKGAFVFCADLLRQFQGVDAQVDFIASSSYGAATESSGAVKILKDLDTAVEGRHVLLVEDIVDTGLTLRYLRDHIERQQPASVRICVLLDKPSRRQVDVPVDYVGFEIPDEFVVGYGIDWAERYRYLPYIGVVRFKGG
ncbi:hypoxanthine phosphoribosyltransferase [Caldinitratiruptor microaerophilus]|uniref:Hypoxanthine phosphoribosyltransferase n=1 Tax=Caldinitratiruptor microaerophilus TaxID=671077 RepID=A0AA35G693_9FIRM|nr:hypoxanthine phosphoribosyltransferase [Caldinitratiruptor microaerophilus]BDG60916.1 hypoxanthine phosphoribosyltransferase [Caldinitratiruptor microaerophilus]